LAGSTGMVFVDGAGSTWTSSGSLSVGDFGAGTLSISHGGAVSNGGGVIGAIAGSTGMVFVDGAGSSLDQQFQPGCWRFRRRHLGDHQWRRGQQRHGHIGNSLGSTAMVSVAGAGSTWTSADMYVGGLSTGTLSISSGGAVSSDTTYIGYGSASTGMVFVDGAGSTWTNSGKHFRRRPDRNRHVDHFERRHCKQRLELSRQLFRQAPGGYRRRLDMEQQFGSLCRVSGGGVAR